MKRRRFPPIKAAALAPIAVRPRLAQGARAPTNAPTTITAPAARYSDPHVPSRPAAPAANQCSIPRTR